MITTEATAPNRLTGLVEDENVTRAYWEQLLRSQPGLDFRRSWSSAEDFLADASHSEVELLLVDLETSPSSMATMSMH